MLIIKFVRVTSIAKSDRLNGNTVSQTLSEDANAQRQLEMEVAP